MNPTLLDFLGGSGEAGAGSPLGLKRAVRQRGGRCVGSSPEGMVHGPLLPCAAPGRAAGAAGGLVLAFFSSRWSNLYGEAFK